MIRAIQRLRRDDFYSLCHQEIDRELSTLICDFVQQLYETKLQENREI